jgi:hypothetical protein
MSDEKQVDENSKNTEKSDKSDKNKHHDRYKVINYMLILNQI